MVTMISAGMLTTPIEVLEPTIETTDYGEERAVWGKIFCKTRCSIARRTGRRVLALGEVTNSGEREIMMRYRKGIHQRQRIRFTKENTVYVIENITPSQRDGSISITLSLLNE